MKIDDEFKSLIPALQAVEYAQLEENLLQNGIREPLSVWDDTLIDGHNRYAIAQKHNLKYETVNYDFESRNDVIFWIIKNQFGRRNLPAYVKGELQERAREIIAEKAKQNQVISGGDKKSVNATLHEPIENITTNAELSKMSGISERQQAKVKNIVEKAIEPIKELARREGITINQAEIASKLDPEIQGKILPKIEEGLTVEKAVLLFQKPHIANNSGNNEWYTPKEYIGAARQVMGDIDLDPASCEIANRVVQANNYYSVETDGLKMPWSGRVWLNPPYAGELIPQFIDKLKYHVGCGDIEQAVVLVNNATETTWFNNLIGVASAVVFPKSRVKFYMPDGKMGAPLQGQAVLYVGGNPEKFMEIFSPFGWGALL